MHVVLVGGSERPYGEPRYLPIFEAAAECGLPVADPLGRRGHGLGGAPGGAGLPTFYIEWHTIGSAGSIMAHLVSLVCHGLFERLPTLRVLLLEGGVAWLPGILWRLDTNWRALRSDTPGSSGSRARSSATTFASPPSRSNTRTVTTRCSSRCSRRRGRPDLLCFASDYPHWDLDDPAYTLGRLPEAWRENVMHGNAAALYGDRLGLVAA